MLVCKVLAYVMGLRPYNSQLRCLPSPLANTLQTIKQLKDDFLSDITHAARAQNKAKLAFA